MHSSSPVMLAVRDDPPLQALLAARRVEVLQAVHAARIVVCGYASPI